MVWHFPFLQELRDNKNLPLPVKTVVISPWLDITLDNPLIKIAKKSDVLLPVETLKQTGIRYRPPWLPIIPLFLLSTETGTIWVKF